MTNWQAGFALAAILQTVVIGIALFRATERPPNRSLALALWVLAGMLVVYPLGWHGRAEVPAWLAFLPVNLPLALGPLLLLHVRRVAQRPVAMRCVHLAPAAGHFAYLATLWLLPTDVAYGWKERAHDPLVKPAVEWAVLVSMAGYALAGLSTLRQYRGRLRAERSDADRHDVRWLTWLLMTLVAATGVLAAARIYTSFVGEIDSSVWFIWFASWAMWLGAAGWRRADRLLPQLTQPCGEAVVEARNWREVGEQWEAITREQGWWRDPDLTLTALARRLGTNTRYLSQAINEGLGVNFNEMVNRLRAEEAAQRVREQPAVNLLEIALDVGFSSKATFNRAFKARFGMSPTTYRRQIGI